MRDRIDAKGRSVTVSDDPVLFEMSGDLGALVSLNRPEAMNAVNGALCVRVVEEFPRGILMASACFVGNALIEGRRRGAML